MRTQSGGESPPIEHPAVAFRDERGSISDLVEHEGFDSASIITSTAGAVRGNHYHNDTYQVIYVLSGTLRLVTQMPGGVVTERTVNAGDLIRTPPAERHAFQATVDATLLVLTRGPRGGGNFESDTIRLSEPLIPR